MLKNQNSTIQIDTNQIILMWINDRNTNRIKEKEFK